MSPPLAEALGLTHAMVAAAKAGDWPHLRRLHTRRARLLRPGLYTHVDAARLLPRLDAAQKELAATLRDETAALDVVSELLRPISDARADIPPPPSPQLADATP